MYPLVTVITVLCLWSLWGYMSSRTEQTAYTIVRTTAEYEVRLYPPHLVAQAVVRGSYESALNEGFRIIASYIFGGNTKKESIAMTAPVIEQTASESIAMTAPVTASIEGDSHVIRFGMPRSYTLATLPVPSDARVTIVTLPEQTMAVMRFSWSRASSRVASKKQALLEALRRDGVTVRGEPQFAGYNAPWTPPWMMRNEVLVEIE